MYHNAMVEYIVPQFDFHQYPLAQAHTSTGIDTGTGSGTGTGIDTDADVASGKGARIGTHKKTQTQIHAQA